MQVRILPWSFPFGGVSEMRQTTLEELMQPEKHDETPNPESDAELIEAAKEYTEEVLSDPDILPGLKSDVITWEVSHRMKTTAGKCISDGPNAVKIRMAWGAYEKFGWDEYAETIRHELIHAWEHVAGDGMSHGAQFKAWIEPLETHRHCRKFSKPKYIIECTNPACNARWERVKRSKIVKHTSRYNCGSCESDLIVRNNP